MGDPVRRPNSSFVEELEELDPFDSSIKAPEQVETPVALVEEAMDVLPLPEIEQPKTADRAEEPPSKEEADSPILDISKSTERIEAVNTQPDEETKTSSQTAEKKPKGRHGGARPGAGRPKGSGKKTKKT